MKQDETYSQRRAAATYRIESSLTLKTLKRKLKERGIEYTRRGNALYVHPNDADKAFPVAYDGRHR